MDIESSFKIIGGLGRFQKFIVISHFLLSVPYGFQMVFMVIAAATPDPNIPAERNMTTIVTEWNLQDSPWIVDLISSLFMVGYGLGCAVMGTICGFGIGGSGHIVFAQMLENIGKEYWGFVGMIYAVFFPLGVMLLSLMGYLLQSWRKVCLVGSVLPLIALPFYVFILPESSRWLYNVGKIEKAEKVIQYIARKNGCHVTDIKLSRMTDNEMSHGTDLKKYSIIDMFKSKRLAIYAIASFYVCIGRKGTLLGCLILSCIASIGMLLSIGLQSDHLTTLQTVFGLTNKLAVSGAFTLMYIYTAEIFPTQLRLVAIGASSLFARMGAILSPFVPLLATVLPYLAYIVYGSSAVLGAALDLVFPETFNKPIPEMSDFLPKNNIRCINNASDVDEDVESNDHLDQDGDPLLKKHMNAYA